MIEPSAVSEATAVEDPVNAVQQLQLVFFSVIGSSLVTYAEEHLLLLVIALHPCTTVLEHHFAFHGLERPSLAVMPFHTL
jgi:hypothetical protein